ncbi:heme exporter protein CcmD [Pseudobacteriovorax antillogorgiicola]|uniref:Heme exporter protein D n=1 Tax=Pseudobacteriovorax antillogorgiicola TaxID=1513793 RepID=A0A1Y6BUM5_9BACT|nr:heme exporter protein CcmD [Pseudobacteriovorax antillogorgiicola]TCS52351.1 heme export protein D (CcmD) [Pseudobacteriovorax antillogorgiicola]SMF29581.1 Heme exporter protein D (CcmD) [Pseudobacteriovorax antillogorgiicola]
MSPYGEGIDPVPFIAGAYGVAVLLIGGFTIWLVTQRRQLRILQEAVKRKD